MKGALRTDQKIIDRYSAVEKLLIGKDMYSPELINEVLPLDRKDRYLFMKNIQLPINVEIYSYYRGNDMGTLWFIWKCGPGVDMKTSNDVLHQIEKEIPVYHTRAMKREFKDKFSLVINNRTILNSVYAYLTGDHSAQPSEISKAVQARLELILQSGGDTELVYDMRSFNEDVLKNMRLSGMLSKLSLTSMNLKQ